MSKCPPCDICGAPAPLTITSRAGTRFRCYAHEYTDTPDDTYPDGCERSALDYADHLSHDH